MEANSPSRRVARSRLQELLREEDVATVVATLREVGYSGEGDDFEGKSLEEVRRAIKGSIAQMEVLDNEVPGAAASIRQGIIDDAQMAEAERGFALENLSEVEIACMEAMRHDFDRGIVLIDSHTYTDISVYRKALKADKTAGQAWEVIQGRLLADKATLLRKAVALSRLTGNQEGKGALLIGVYRNGRLAIRQRSQEIVNARWTKDWIYWGRRDPDRGKLRLLYHPEAMAQKVGEWAKAVEILRAVAKAGYHVPADSPNCEKRGLVAASEAVTGAPYVMSPNDNDPYSAWWREAILKCPEDLIDSHDSADVRVVGLNGKKELYTYISNSDAGRRVSNLGAVLWL